LKYYVVRAGKKVGIFTSRNEVQPLVVGFPAAKYKAFPSLSQAEEALQQGREPYYQTKPASKSRPRIRHARDEQVEVPFVRESIAVDAACSGNPGVLEYRGVDLQTGKELFRQRFEL
jgi:ribonuclease HI